MNEPDKKRSELTLLEANLKGIAFTLQEEPKTQKKGFSHRLWKETKKSFTGWSLLGLTAGLGAAGIAYSKDEEVRNWFLEGERLGDASKYGEVMGQGYAHVVLDFPSYSSKISLSFQSFIGFPILLAIIPGANFRQYKSFGFTPAYWSKN